MSPSQRRVGIVAALRGGALRSLLPQCALVRSAWQRTILTQLSTLRNHVAPVRYEAANIRYFRSMGGGCGSQSTRGRSCIPRDPRQICFVEIVCVCKDFGFPKSLIRRASPRWCAWASLDKPSVVPGSVPVASVVPCDPCRR